MKKETNTEQIHTDSSECRICGNCKFYSTALRTRDGKPCCTRLAAALAVSKTSKACRFFIHR